MDISANKINRIKTTKSDRAIDWTINGIMLILIIVAVYPLIYVLSVSLSSGLAVDRGQVYLFPVDFTLEAYRYLFKDGAFIMAFANSMFYMFAGTFYNMVISVMAAYVLARKEFILTKYINLLVIFTMWLSAGTIPEYMNFRNLNMVDSRMGMILGFGLSAYNIILIRNYFEGLPKEILEASKIDGASEFQVLTKVYIPLSKPILATVSLFYALYRWNTWFWFSLLIKTESKVPLQVVLRMMLIRSAENPDSTANDIVEIVQGGANYTTIQYAVMLFSIIPVLMVYPYVQKHFTKGIMLGGVKS